MFGEIPGEEETLLVERGCRDGRGNASVGDVFEFLYSNFSTKLCICYNHQGLSTHMESTTQTGIGRGK